MIKVINIKNIEDYKLPISKDIIEKIKTRRITNLENVANALIMSFDIYDIKNLKSGPGEVSIYYSHENLFFFCERENEVNIVNRNIKTLEDTEKILIGFFMELFTNDLDFLEDLEYKIEELEYGMLNENKLKCLDEILLFRKKLFSLKKYYEHLGTILDELILNENNLFDQEELKYFKLIYRKIDRLEKHTINLKENLSQVRETYQAQIDIEQNRLMKIFTIITSVFLPLTLIAGWYGMNLKMPEYGWEYGYPWVIFLSIVVMIVSFILIKTKKWY